MTVRSVYLSALAAFAGAQGFSTTVCGLVICLFGCFSKLWPKYLFYLLIMFLVSRTLDSVCVT